MGAELAAKSLSDLPADLRFHRVDEEIVRIASRAIGFTNFYGAFRNVAGRWIGRHLKAVADTMRHVAHAHSDTEVRDAYDTVARLPPLPRPNQGDMPAFNLLTPALACLDPRGRSPIINSRDAVRRLLRTLKLGSSSLVQQFDGLSGLIGQGGFEDAFALDTAEAALIERAIRGTSRSRPSPPPGRGRASKRLSPRSDEDIEFLHATSIVKVRRLHNSMTNALLAICADAGLEIVEGSEHTCLFDALVRDYAGTERHLMIEVKTDDAPPLCRMAVGQLFDYRRRHHDRAAIDLAVLLPKRPSREAKAFFGYVGVKALWLDRTRLRIRGAISIG